MQQIRETELRRILVERGYWNKIHSGQLLERVRKTTPAVIAPGGVSQIVSYWEEHIHYLCTLHRVISKEGQTVHEDVKDAVLDGIRYRAIKE